MDKPEPSTFTNVLLLPPSIASSAFFVMDCDVFVFTDYNLSLEKYQLTSMLNISPDAA